MPKQPGHRTKKLPPSDRPLPACGVIIERAAEPFSPWQLMVENTRLGMDPEPLSMRALGELSGIPHGTLYGWTLAKSGHPPKKSYTADVNHRLSRALGIAPQALMDAWDASVTRSTNVSPEKLTELIDMVEQSGRKTWKTAEVLYFLKSLK